MAVGFETPVVTIGLVQGDALGGGFEGALSFQILVAEKKARMGFPKCCSTCFRAWARCSLLARKIGMAQAERMILSGKIYTASDSTISAWWTFSPRTDRAKRKFAS